MTEIGLNESVIEQAALAWLESLGYTVLHGPEIAMGEPAAERTDPGYHDVILESRLKQALQRLNPALPPEAIEDAYRRLIRAGEPSLETRNHGFHQKLVEGVTVEYTRPDGSIGGALVHVFDFDNPDHNDWVAVNQFTVVEGQNNRRPDVLIFINGLPIGLMELKNPADENATIWSAFQQIQTYKAQIPSLFTYNELLIISDGMEGRVADNPRLDLLVKHFHRSLLLAVPRPQWSGCRDVSAAPERFVHVIADAEITVQFPSHDLSEQPQRTLVLLVEHARHEPLSVRRQRSKRFIADAEMIAELDFSEACADFVKAERRFRNLDEHPDVVTDSKLNVCWWNAMERLYLCDKALWEMFTAKDRSRRSNMMYNEFRSKLIAGKSLRADA